MPMRNLCPLLAAVALLFAAAPTAGAGHPPTTCDAQEEIHTYVASPGTLLGASVSGEWTIVGADAVVATDACVDLGEEPFQYDGDSESAIAGGRFMAGTGACFEPQEVPHHAFGPGATYWARDAFSPYLLYFAGADGPAHDPDDPCATDGVISSDATSDPFDCGAGEVGYATPYGWGPATLGETVSGNGACDPFDGTVWVFVYRGAYVDAGTGDVFVSTPIIGHIWSDGSGLASG